MKFSRALSLAAVLAAISALVLAQQSEPSGHAPDTDSFERIMNITITAVTGAPFSSIVTAEWTKTLEDGSTITRWNRRMVLRDAAGRIYQERRILVPKDAQIEPRLARIEISDPGKHSKYFCQPDARECVLRDYSGPAAEDTEPTGSFGEGKMVLAREDLGKGNMSGVDVIGTKETRTIAAGVIGNDRPVTITKEFWYSQQLGLNMMVKRSDPRVGTQTFQVTEVSLAEPDPKWFQAPPGYKVVDMRQPTSKGAR